MTTKTASGRTGGDPSAKRGGARIGWLTVAALALLLCGGWTADTAASGVALAPAIVVRPRPVDDTSVFQRNGREIGIGAGAVVSACFFFRRMTRRGGE